MDLRDLEKAYVASLPDVSLVNTLPVKALRFIITATVGAIDPVISIVIGSIDGFFVEMWLTGYAPKLFIDEMKNLTSHSIRPGLTVPRFQAVGCGRGGPTEYVNGN